MLIDTFFANLASLIPFAGSYAVLATIPGPNFMVVADAGLSSSRIAALLAAAGVATGAMVLAALMASGVSPFAGNSGFRELAALVFFAFMSWIGYKAIARALRNERKPPRASYAARRTYFIAGLVTAATNPASAIFFGSALLGKVTPALAAVPAVVFVIAVSWFGLVGLALTMPAVRALHDRHWRSFDAASGIALIGLGLSSALTV